MERNEESLSEQLDRSAMHFLVHKDKMDFVIQVKETKSKGSITQFLTLLLQSTLTKGNNDISVGSRVFQLTPENALEMYQADKVIYKGIYLSFKDTAESVSFLLLIFCLINKLFLGIIIEFEHKLSVS